MNTNSFQSEVNKTACKVEDEMRSICGTETIGDFNACVAKCYVLHPFNKDKRDACISACSAAYAPLPPPPPPPPPPPAPTQPGGEMQPVPGASSTYVPHATAGSFATQSIDTWLDAGNFFKAAGIMMLGASLHPALIIPTAIILCVSFLYSIRKLTFKF